MNLKEHHEIIEFFNASVRQPLLVVEKLFDGEQYEGAAIACKMIALDSFTRKLKSMIDVEKPQDSPTIDAEYVNQEDQVVETEKQNTVL